MKPQLLLLAFITTVVFTNCTTAYKTGQTPDDVYFSPAQPQDEYVRVERKENRRYEGTDEYYDDRYLRMKVQNRNRWNDLDDWYYYGNRYNYSYYNYNYWNNPWTPYTYWNCTYNPYYQGTVIISPRSSVYSAPRTFNLNNYNSASIANNNYSNPKTAGGTNGPRYNYSTSQNSSGNSNSTRSNGNTGSFLRNVFTGNNNSSSNSSSSNTNTNTNSNNSSSSSSNNSSGSSSSGSGSSAPVRRF
ncbi:MAG TPA: hypothetical protein VF487_05960 [Chitinophagaceae bacterium]